MEGCSQRELAEVIEVRPITLGRRVDLLEARASSSGGPIPSIDVRCACT